MATLTVTVSGSRAVIEKMQKLGQSLYEFEPEFNEIGKMQAEFYGNDAFNSRGSVYGQEWTPLNPAYAAWKAQNYPGRPMEVQSGEMRSSFAWKATPVMVIISNTAKTKSGIPLLALQQAGSNRGLPPRLIMALEQTQVTKIETIIKEAVTRKIEEA